MVVSRPPEAHAPQFLSIRLADVKPNSTPTALRPLANTSAANAVPPSPRHGITESSSGAGKPKTKHAASPIRKVLITPWLSQMRGYNTTLAKSVETAAAACTTPICAGVKATPPTRTAPRAQIGTTSLKDVHTTPKRK